MSRAAIVLLLLPGCIPQLTSQNGAVPWSWSAPDNDWPTAEPPQGTVGVGFDNGQVVPDFLLTDQHGDDVSLWQFYGNVVLLDISTMWCAPCRDLAEHTQETWDDYVDDGFVYITVLQEDVEGDAPSQENLNEWADAYGIESPVVADGDKAGTGDAIRQGQFPAVLVIDRQLKVAERVNPPEDGVVRAAIERAL